MGKLAKEKIKRKIKRTKKLRVWQLILMLILMLFVSATLLRLDNIGMIQRRDSVLSADKEGDQKILSDRLVELKRYVFAHMNANTDRFYLINQYERDAQAILTRAQQETTATGSSENVYKKVANICDPLAERYGWGYSQPYFDCISRELSKYAAADETSTEAIVELPNKELYGLGYASPIWAPSMSGFSVLICFILIVMIVIKLVYAGVLGMMLRKYKDG